VHRACAGAGRRQPDESNPTDILDWGKALVKAGARLSPSEKRKVNGGNRDDTRWLPISRAPMNTNVVSTAAKRCGILESSRLRPARRTRTRDQLLDPRQDTRHDHVDTGGVWVHSIALVQLGIGGHSVKEEWIKDDRVS
jgi:hypothetical protein